ncbi:MAG: hypothetical protein R3282_09675 [Rhodothermales bacterium]|nr:hypothetical protein [Rhodothermales bacterium]
MSIRDTFIRELRRRQVFGIAVACVASAWVLLQVSDVEAVRSLLGVSSEVVLNAAIKGHA